MKVVSVNDLKRNLSGYLEQAVLGEPIVVTRYRRPWAKLSAAVACHVIEGRRLGKLRLAPVLAQPLPEAARRLLADDREDTLERPS